MKQAIRACRLLAAISLLVILSFITGCKSNTVKPAVKRFSIETNLVVDPEAFKGEVYSSPIPVRTILDLLMEEDFAALDQLYEEFAQAYARNPHNDQAYVWSYRPFRTAYNDIVKKVKLWESTGSRHARLAYIVSQPYTLQSDFFDVKPESERDENGFLKYKSVDEYPEYKALVRERIQELTDFITLYPTAIPVYCAVREHSEFSFAKFHPQTGNKLTELALQGVENNPYSFSALACALGTAANALPKAQRFPLNRQIVNRSKPLWKHYPKTEAIYWAAYFYNFGVDETIKLVEKRVSNGSVEAQAHLITLKAFKAHRGGKTVGNITTMTQEGMKLDAFNYSSIQLFADTLLDRAYFLINKGNKKEALKILDLFDPVELQPYVAFDEMANVYIQIDEPLKAAQVMEQYISFNGDTELALNKLKALYMRMERFEQARGVCFRLKVLDDEYMCEEEQDAI